MRASTPARVLHVDPRKSRCLGADADDEVIKLVALGTGHNCLAVDNALGADDVHALAFAGGLDASAHGQDDFLLALHHPGEVDLRFGNANPERRGVADLAQHVGTGEQ